jgi:hypothetical protein
VHLIIYNISTFSHPLWTAVTIKLTVWITPTFISVTFEMGTSVFFGSLQGKSSPDRNKGEVSGFPKGGGGASFTCALDAWKSSAIAARVCIFIVAKRRDELDLDTVSYVIPHET